jgi:hypothetical protein
MLHVINTHGGPKEGGGWMEMLLENANLKVNTHDDDNEGQYWKNEK